MIKPDEMRAWILKQHRYQNRLNWMQLRLNGVLAVSNSCPFITPAERNEIALIIESAKRRTKNISPVNDGSI